MLCCDAAPPWVSSTELDRGLNGKVLAKAGRQAHSRMETVYHILPPLFLILFLSFCPPAPKAFGASLYISSFVLSF